jgi:hypothetical protein
LGKKKYTVMGPGLGPKSSMTVLARASSNLLEWTGLDGSAWYASFVHGSFSAPSSIAAVFGCYSNHLSESESFSQN